MVLPVRQGSQEVKEDKQEVHVQFIIDRIISIMNALILLYFPYPEINISNDYLITKCYEQDD